MKHAPGFVKLVNNAKKRVKEITVVSVKEKLKNEDDFVLIDTREEHEWNEAHVAGAVFLSKGIIEREIETKVTDKSTEIVLYCGGGFRSALAADNLRKMGYKKVFSMAGGWREWKKKRGKTER